MESVWRDREMSIQGDQVARDSYTGSFVETLRREIHSYAKLLTNFLKREGSATTVEAADTVDQQPYFNDATSDDLEHDQLLYRAQTTTKEPRLLPKAWLIPTELGDLDAKYEDYFLNTPASTRVRGGDLDVASLRCLEPFTWLNDEVMNAYVDLINAACQKLGLPVHCWNTFFWPNLTGSEGRGYDYDKVRRWTKRRHIDIFELELIFIPLHVNHVHWSLGLIDMKSKLIFFFDSMGFHAPDHYIKTCRRYLEDEWSDKKNPNGDDEPFDSAAFLYAGNNFALSAYSSPTCDIRDCLLDPNGDVRQACLPKQQNGSDCGVFTCLFMRELAFNRFPFNFTEDVRLVRQIMLREIVEGSIDLPT